MSFPLHEWPAAVDYNELIEHVEKKYNINTRDYAGKYSGETFDANRPYLDYWHQHCDDINRGGINYLYIGDDGCETWVAEINALLRAELEGCPAYDPEEQFVACHIDW